MLALVLLAGAGAAAPNPPTTTLFAAADPTHTQIAPGVSMPFVNDGIVLDTRGNGTRPNETASLELFFSLGGRGADTAWSYHDQPAVGRAIRGAPLPRSELFVTTKIECMGSAEGAYLAIERDLLQLGLPQTDLVLIHSPFKGGLGEPPVGNCSEGPAGAAARQATWQGMERALKAGLTRAIGLSNFDVAYMNDILQGATVTPAVNQCCLSVGQQARRQDEITFAKAHGITYQAYSPLGGADIGGTSVLSLPQLKQIAAKHGKSTAQIALKWLVQHGHPFATATGRAEYMKEDLSLFDFELTEAEMATLDAVDVPLPKDCKPHW